MERRFGIDIKRVERLSDGQQSALFDAHGNKYGPFDLVVVGDGAKSQLRPERARVRPYEWGGYVCCVVNVLCVRIVLCLSCRAALFVSGASSCCSANASVAIASYCFACVIVFSVLMAFAC